MLFYFHGRINMKPESLESAVVYLADAKAEFRRLMQDALRGYSFREVRAFPGLGEFKNALVARVPLDLIIVDADLPDGDVFETIAKMRHGDIGYNPFVPVIALAWNTEGAVIGNAIDSGVDSIVAAPISANLSKTEGLFFSDVFRGYRYPYDWVPQLDQPEERAVIPPPHGEFRIPAVGA